MSKSNQPPADAPVSPPFCADGLSFTPPGLWDLAQFRFGEQHFRDGGLFAQFDDLLRERIIFRWYNRLVDPKRLATSYIANLGDEIRRNLPAGIPQPEIVPGPFEAIPAAGLSGNVTRCIFKSGEMFGRIYTFAWPDAAVKRTALLCLAYSAAENNRTVENWESALLASLRFEPAAVAGNRAWSLGGMRFDAPAALMLWEAEAFAGQFKLALRPERRFLKQHRGQELVLFRSGLAATSLAKSSLQTVALGWLKTIQGPRSPKFIEDGTELVVERLPANPLTRLAAKAKTLSRRARGDRLRGLVRHRTEDNALTGVFWFSHDPIDTTEVRRLDASLVIASLEGHPQMSAQAGLVAAAKLPLPALDSKGQPIMTRPWQWRTLVLRNPTASTEPLHDGLRMRLPVQPSKMTGMLRRFSGMGSTPLPDKVVELDEIGAELWQQFDGKADLWQITSQFSRKYRLGIRESERLIWQHLQNMVKRGIIGLAIPRLKVQEAPFENAPTH